MRKLSFILMICILSICLSENSFAVVDNKIGGIKNAITRILCFDAYWEWSDYSLRAALPMRIKIIDDKDFHVWINDFEVTKNIHMAGYFAGRFRNGKAAIIRQAAYNINLSPAVREYLKNKTLFDNKDVIDDVLKIPHDCTAHYDPPTPQKELMLNTVVSTVQKQLKSWVRQGIEKYPREVTLIIADFNVDYPSTYVLVEPTDNVYTVTLHDPQNYDSDEYERSGEYPFGERYNKSKSLLDKIRKHGIAKKILLSP